LQKDRELRFRNVAELAQDLEPYGPQGSAARVSRIVQVVRRGGQTIRPATPAAFPVQGVPVVTPSTPVVVDRHRETVVLRRGSFPVWRMALAAFAGCVVVGASVLLLRARSAPPFPPAAAAPATATLEPPPVVPPAVTEEPSTTTAATAPAPSAPPPPASIQVKARHAPKPAPASDRRALFGERK
jgi:hypothetical protein